MISKTRDILRSAMPRSLYSAQLIYRRAGYWKDVGIIFIHVPKNGGTSINNALYGRFMGHYTIAEVSRWCPRLYSKLPSLGVTRNPWARVLSAYRFARAGRSMTDGAQISNPERYQTAAFENFERFVIEWLDGRDLAKEDNVFRPQSRFLMRKDGNIGVSHVGLLENPKSYIDFLETTLGRQLDIAHLNRTEREVGYTSAFTTEMKDIVARAYADDIKRFGYDF